MEKFPAISFDLKDAGPKFREIRLSLGIKQREVKEVTGVHSGNLSRFEKGEKVLPTTRVISLFRSLGCEVTTIQRMVVMPPEKLSAEEMQAMEEYADLTRGSKERDVNNENVALRDQLDRLASGIPEN